MGRAERRAYRLKRATGPEFRVAIIHLFEIQGFVDVEQGQIRYVGESGRSADSIQRLVEQLARNDGVPVTPDYVWKLPDRLHNYSWAELHRTRVFYRPGREASPPDG